MPSHQLRCGARHYVLESESHSGRLDDRDQSIADRKDQCESFVKSIHSAIEGADVRYNEAGPKLCRSGKRRCSVFKRFWMVQRAGVNRIYRETQVCYSSLEFLLRGGSRYPECSGRAPREG
jgi:hypothetical protein